MPEARPGGGATPTSVDVARSLDRVARLDATATPFPAAMGEGTWERTWETRFA